MFKNLINGEWASGPRASRKINPSDTRDLVGEYARAEAEQARAAIAAASKARAAWAHHQPRKIHFKETR